jgi:hypothetical protein
MILKLIVDDTQVGDQAPRNREGKFKILRDQFCCIGETISPIPSVRTTFDSLKKSDVSEKSTKLIDDLTYNINGEILAGILGSIGSGNVYLIIDCGVLLRVCLKDPREYQVIASGSGWKRYAPLKKEGMRKFVFRKNDFINFNGKINAMWLDTWEGIVRTNMVGKVIDRIDRGKDGLILTVECSLPEKPLIEVDELFCGKAGWPRIWGDSTEFSIEY